MSMSSYCSSSIQSFSIMKADAPSYLKRFLMEKDGVENKTRRTVFNYYINLRTFFRWMLVKQGATKQFEELEITPLPIEDVCGITAADITEFLVFCKNERDNSSAKSIATKLTAIREFYDYLIEIEKLIPANPAAHIKSPKLEKKLPKYLTQDECVLLLDSIEGSTPARDRCLILWVIHTGLRLNELVSVNMADINIKEKRLRIIGKGNVERIVFFNDECVEAYNRYLEERLSYSAKPMGDALFVSQRTGKRLSGRRVEQIVEAHLLHAGLEGKGISPHKLRHTAATNMYQAGVDLRQVQEILGHQSLATTQIYTHVKPEMLRETMSHNYYDPQAQDGRYEQ